VTVASSDAIRSTPRIVSKVVLELGMISLALPARRIENHVVRKGGRKRRLSRSRGQNGERFFKPKK
jgi:hypothetical protein